MAWYKWYKHLSNIPFHHNKRGRRWWSKAKERCSKDFIQNRLSQNSFQSMHFLFVIINTWHDINDINIFPTYLSIHPTEDDLNSLMEDNLKNLKVEYLSNHLLDHTQILNLSLNDQTIFWKSVKLRWPQMEDNIKILKVEYLSNHLLDHTQILNLWVLRGKLEENSE
jgi:hypothetical protein